MCRVIQLTSVILAVLVFFAQWSDGQWWTRRRRRKSVCYGKYGCFSGTKPFNRPLIPLPQPPSSIGVKYYLTTRRSPAATTVINDSNARLLRLSGYNGRKRTVIIIHGFREKVNDAWITEMRKALINKEDVNVIVVGWNAMKPYWTSVANTRVVGSMTAQLIRFLNRQKRNTPASFHIIGFSLGAQIAGYVGRRLRKSNAPLGRITGLDPAGPGFKGTHKDVKLDSTDASFVDVIHTDAGSIFGLKFGTTDKSGHLDFWPNGGRKQRGCKKLICDHLRAPSLYIETITSQCAFRSYRCSSWGRFNRGSCMNCAGNSCPEMGHNASKYKGLASGNFYLYTNENKPFCVYRYVYVTLATGKTLSGLNPRIRIYGTRGRNTGTIKLAKRRIRPRSTERFIAPLKANIGTLTRIEVWNEKLWNLKKVTVQYVQGRKRFTACFGRSLWSKAVSKNLRHGDVRC